MKLIIIIIICFFLSCSNNHSYNFDKLSLEFEKWYKSRMNDEIYLSIYNNNYKNEFINDLKRLKFEFSQINLESLNLNDRLYYNIINDRINDLFIKNEEINFSDYDPSIIFKDLYERLFNLLCNKTIFSLDSFELSINNIKKHYANIHPGVFVRVESYINKSILLIDDYISINNNDIFYKKLNTTKNNLNNIKVWIRDNLNVNNSIVNKNKINIYNKKTQNILRKNPGYNYNDIIKFIEFQVASLQDRIFDLSLPVYLEYNDEPIWIDRQDSLNVINEVLINKKNILFFNGSEICIDNTSNKDVLISNKNIKSKVDNMCPSYNISIHINEIFEILNNFLDIDNPYIEDRTDCFNNLNYRIYESYKISSDYIDYNIEDKSSSNASSIENMLIIENYYLPTLLTDNSIYLIESSDFALKDIFFRIVLEELENNNKGINLFYYLNKLRLMTKILLKNEYVFNNIKESEAINFLINKGLYNSESAKLIWEEIIYPDNYYLDKYLASVKLNEIYDENCVIKNQYTNKEFVLKIISFDSIPFYMFNEFLN